MVWLTSLPTTFNPMIPVREVPKACVNYKQLNTFTSSHFTLVLSVTGIDYLPLLPMSRLSRNLGKASQVCLPSSCNRTRLTPLEHSFNWGSGAFYLFYRASQFSYRVTYNLRRELPLQWKEKKKISDLLFVQNQNCHH